jgi:hypothetical protein
MFCSQPREGDRAQVGPLRRPRADVERIPGKYLSITSFRRNGSGVATRCGSPRRVIGAMP